MATRQKFYDNSAIRLFLGLVVGALALSVEIFFQQAMMNQNPFVLKSYFVPVIYGGISGIVISYFINKNQQSLKYRYQVEHSQKTKFQKEFEKTNKLLKQMKNRLQHEVNERQHTSAALRKAKNEIISLADEGQILGRVLIVDDDLSFLRMIMDQMGGIEFNLITAAGGREGLMKMAQNPVDLVIADYKMPEMSGADFLKNTKFDFPSVSRAVMSDFDYHPSVVKILTEGLATTAFARPTNGDASELFSAIVRLLKIRKRINDQKIRSLMTSIDRLPQLPHIFNEFSDAIRRESNYQILADIVSKDTGIATKLMQLANSAFLAAEKTSSLEQSIMMLGVNACRDIVLTVSLIEQGTEKAQHMDYLQKVMKHSMVVNKYLDPVSKLVLGSGIDKNYKSIGLTHDIGKMVLLQYFPDRFEKIISYQYSHPHTSFYDSEIALGYDDCTHAEVGAYLLDLWNFPEASVEVALFHHNPSTARDAKHSDLLRTVSVTNELVNYLTRPVNLENINFNNIFKAIKNDLV